MCQLVLAVNLTQPKITWEESLNEELSRRGWPVGMSGGEYLDAGRLSPSWAALFPRPGVLHSVRES